VPIDRPALRKKMLQCRPEKVTFPSKKAAAREDAMTAQIERRTTTMDDPYVIANPALNFLNLAGEAGNELMARDYAALEFVFNGNIQIANRNLPRCNVLFLYGALDASGRLAGNSFTFRDVIKGAGAHIAVLASELPPDLLSHPEFMKGLPGNGDWPANIVITLRRNGEHFGRFFHQLFTFMLAGTSMPLAWVQLAPQVREQRTDVPVTISLMEAGHIAFSSEED